MLNLVSLFSIMLIVVKFKSKFIFRIKAESHDKNQV